MPDDTDAIRTAATARLAALRRAAADHEALFNAAFAMGRLAGGVAELESLLSGFDQQPATPGRRAGDAKPTELAAAIHDGLAAKAQRHINGLAARAADEAGRPAGEG